MPLNHTTCSHALIYGTYADLHTADEQCAAEHDFVFGVARRPYILAGDLRYNGLRLTHYTEQQSMVFCDITANAFARGVLSFDLARAAYCAAVRRRADSRWPAVAYFHKRKLENPRRLKNMARIWQ